MSYTKHRHILRLYIGFCENFFFPHIFHLQSSKTLKTLLLERHFNTLYHKQTNIILIGFVSDRIPVLREGKLPVVGIGKHLCGVATGKPDTQYPLN